MKLSNLNIKKINLENIDKKYLNDQKNIIHIKDNLYIKTKNVCEYFLKYKINKFIYKRGKHMRKKHFHIWRLFFVCLILATIGFFCLQGNLLIDFC